MLGVPEIKQYEKYLGLPSFIGRGKKASLMFIKEGVWAKIRGWKGKLLSQAGREVLLKAVVQAILAYSMSCFKLPQSLCYEIEIMIRKFWWGQRGERRKIHWVKWSKMCRPKHEGGMGFRELQKFNDTLLAKQVWRLMISQDSLFSRFFKSKFFPHGTIFDAKENKGSFAWKSILKGREVIKKGMRWRIGDGSCVKIYQDHWLPGSNLGKVLSPMLDINMDATVDILIDQDLLCWRILEIERLFLPFEAKLIQGIPLSFVRNKDSVFWPRNHDRNYSVKSGYKLLLEDEVADLPGASNPCPLKGVWKEIWKLKVPPRIRNLLWRAGFDSLPMWVNLAKRKVLTDTLCPHCNLEPEDTVHTLWSCPSLTEVWQSQFESLQVASKNCRNFLDLLLLAH